MRYVGLLLYHGESIEDCAWFLSMDPHPRWDGPPGSGFDPIEEVSGPFRIVPAFLDGGVEQSWCVFAEHDTEAVRSPVAYPYGTADNSEILRDSGLKWAISSAIRQHIGRADEDVEGKCIAEIGRLIREEAALYEADAIEYGTGFAHPHRSSLLRRLMIKMGHVAHVKEAGL